MKPLFIQYSKCGTCQKAAKWLKAHNIDVEVRDIVTENPTRSELDQWITQSGTPASKFFNTSGLRYRALNIKDRIKTSTTDELIDILATEGMLVKRPVLVAGDKILVGFKEDEWTKALL